MSLDKNKNEIYLVGDIRYTSKAKSIDSNKKASEEFLKNLQELMEEYGVVKIDIALDPFVIGKLL